MDLQTGFVRAKCKNFNLLDFKEDALLPLGMFWLQRGKKQEPPHSGEKKSDSLTQTSYHRKLVDTSLSSL